MTPHELSVEFAHAHYVCELVATLRSARGIPYIRDIPFGDATVEFVRTLPYEEMVRVRDRLSSSMRCVEECVTLSHIEAISFHEEILSYLPSLPMAHADGIADAEAWETHVEGSPPGERE